MEKKKTIEVPALFCRKCNPYTWDKEPKLHWPADIYKCENCGLSWPKVSKEEKARLKEIDNDLNNNSFNHLH
jgi:hypothetical protein